MSALIGVIAALVLDPANSTTPHCIEEYNAGLRNASDAILAAGYTEPTA